MASPIVRFGPMSMRLRRTHTSPGLLPILAEHLDDVGPDLADVLVAHGLCGVGAARGSSDGGCFGHARCRSGDWVCDGSSSSSDGPASGSSNAGGDDCRSSTRHGNRSCCIGRRGGCVEFFIETLLVVEFRAAHETTGVAANTSEFRAAVKIPVMKFARAFACAAEVVNAATKLGVNPMLGTEP